MMRKILQSLHEQIRCISQPNPQRYPDLSTQKLLWNRNIINIYICIIFTSLCIFNASFSNFSSTAETFHIKSNLFITCIFLLLCRSYLWLFNLLYTTFVALAGFTLLDHALDAAYVYLGYTFVLLPFMMLRTGEIKLATFIGVVQVFTYLTRFKEKLVILLQEEEPEIFADRLIKTTLFWFLTTILVSFSVMKTLDRRTMELSHAKRALETALENQKTFIFSFSHELRNPINSLLGNLQLVLQGEVLSQKATEMVKVAKTCGEILLHGINNVLETGKREMGKLEVNPIPTQIQEMLQRTWGIYGEILKQKKLENKLKIDQEMPNLVKIDAHKVNQVLLNLIGNSIKFTEQGSITVTCKWLKSQEVNDECFEPIPYDEEDEGVFEKDENLERYSSSPRPRWKGSLETCRGSSVYTFETQEEARGVLKIIVKDTGCGMKKEALEKLFKKFSQVSENISQRQIGTGLGLFITKEICNSMGGEIRAYSKLGVGATFVVCIPTVALPSDPIQRVDTQEILKYLAAKHLKAVIADDSPFNVNLISDYFSKFGGSVISKAYNGYEAFVKYQECRSENLGIDIVVLDLDMPVMDGKTACEKIRKYEKENKLKPAIIIFMSGNSGKEQTGESPGKKNRYQADYFLKKPVSFQDFLQAIYYCSRKEQELK